MRLKSILIVVLLAAVSIDASAQRKKPVKKKAPAAKTAKARTGAKPKADAKNKKAGAPTAKGLPRDTVKGTTIEVIQSYKPELRQAPKPEISPAMPPADTSKPVFAYEVPQQTLYYTYSSFPLRPLALGRDTANLPLSNYAKIGAGNLSTFLLDAGIGSLRGADYETAIQLHHLSRSGQISGQQAMSTGIAANGTLHRDGMAHSAFVNANRDQYHYYGYDHDVLNYTRDNIRQVFTDVNFGFSTKNEGEGYMGLNYNPSLAFSLFGDRYDAAERSIDLRVPVSYDLDSSIKLQMGINLLYTRYINDATGINTNNNILQLTPGVHFRNDVIKGYAGLYPTFGKDASYLLPDVNVSFSIPSTQISFTAGYLAQLRQNTYEQLSTRNPYMFNSYDIRQTRTDELFAAARTNIGNHLYVDAKLSWQQYSNLPLFINDTLGDQKQFLIVYDNKLRAIVLEGTVRYQVANKFSVGISPAFYRFYNRAYAHVWHEPAIRIKGDLMIRPIKDLTVTAYLSVMDGLYAVKKGNVSQDLDPVIDLGGAAEYEITKRISAFGQVNNLLNNRYERWYGYEAFGFNIFAGIRLKF